MLDKNTTGSDCFRPTSLPNQSIYICKILVWTTSRIEMSTSDVCSIDVSSTSTNYTWRVQYTNWNDPFSFVTNSSATPALTFNGSTLNNKHNYYEFNSQWFKSTFKLMTDQRLRLWSINAQVWLFIVILLFEQLTYIPNVCLTISANNTAISTSSIHLKG